MRLCSPKTLLTLLFLTTLARGEVQIHGVSDEIARNVRSFLALASEPCDAEAWLIRRRFRNVEVDVRTALEPFGFYDPVIEKDLVLDETCWRATITIDAGSPVLLRDVDISIATPPQSQADFSDIETTTTLQSGAPLRHADYEALKRSLQVRAADLGYIEATFTENAIDVWPSELSADVLLQYASGPRYDFGEIRLEQDFLEQSLVRSFLEFDTGMPYDSRLLSKAYQDLSLSGYFSRIDLLTMTEEASDGAIPVRIVLEPADRIEYTVGAGYSTDSGPRGRAGFQNRRLNDKGHRFKSDINVSSVLQGLTAEHRRPMADPRSEWLSYTAALTHEDTDTFDSDTARVGFRRTKRMSTNWLRTLSLDLSYDRFDVGADSDRTRLVLPAVVFDHKRADRDIFPTRGRRLTFELRGTGQFLGSNTSFLQVIVSGRLVRSVSANARILARATVGFTAKSEFNELPPSVRFFAGGDESVRGFGYNTLGPKDDLGNVIGGSNLLVASIEYERWLRGNFYGIAFVDAGNAFDATDVDAAAGAGFGLRWQSPVGPLRFYLAHPLNKSDRSVRLHVRLGADL